MTSDTAQQPPHSQSINFSIPNNVLVAVENNFSLLTTFVLAEQGDWFERELPWLRNYLKPGMRVVDIGANHGVYSLSLAQRVGPTGRVWALEPNPEAFQLLEISRTQNGFDHLELHRKAASLKKGTINFYTNENSEFSSTTPFPGSTRCITVETESLDHFAESNKVNHVDFLKLDAEGEEINILEGGRRFFDENDPLILCEITETETGALNIPLLDKLEGMGYHAYRLIPGMGVLTPFNRRGIVDLQCLNVILCKKSRAESLEKAGLLCLAYESLKLTNIENKAFPEYLSGTAYGNEFPSNRSLTDFQNRPDGETYLASLNAASIALGSNQPIGIRIALLEAAFNQLEHLCRTKPSLARAVTFIRAARAWGHRDIAKLPLRNLSKRILEGMTCDVDEPFFSPTIEFDPIDPGSNLQAWLAASILHEYLTSYELSFAFWRTGLPFAELKKLEQLNFLLPNMRRRYNLIKSAEK